MALDYLKIKFPLILIILMLSLTTIIAQSKLCFSCNKEIKTDYLAVDNKSFHTSCFLCEFCDKQITEGYSRNEEFYYHSNCYLENFINKCDVCGKPLTGKFFVDLYDNKYHTNHLDEYDNCDNCTRLICDNITKGGLKYRDGRKMCNICYRNGANGQYEYDDILVFVLSKLKKLGLNIKSENVSIKAVERDELKNAAGRNYSDQLKGYNNTNIRFVDGKEEVKYTIFVLTMIPKEHIESIVAHELMHVWLHQNTHDNHDAVLKEGSCNYISYIYI